MASVTDLLLAAKQKKSPFISLLEGVASGYGQAQREAPQRRQMELEMQAKQIAMENERQDRERQAKFNDEMRAKLAGAQEQQTAQSLNGVNTSATPPMASSRLKEKISRDAKGNYSSSFEVVEPKAASYQAKDYMDASGRERIGKFDSTTGKLIQSPDDAYAPKSAGAAAAQNGKILPASSVLALNEGQSVARMLPDVEKAIQSNSSIMGPVGGRVRGANPYDTNAQTTDAQFRAASQSFGRFMEGGVLRKEDEEKYRKMFPQFSDKPDVAKNKLSIVRRLLASKYESDRTTMGKSGYDVSGFGSLEIPASLFDAPPAQAGGLSKSEQDELAELEQRFGGGE